jgi:hypothetical protein
MVAADDDPQVDKFALDRVERYLPLAIGVISGLSYGMALPRFFLFVHRVMGVRTYHCLQLPPSSLYVQLCVLPTQ